MPEATVQIVPLFQPVIDGVGDYALSLARHVQRSSGQPSRFVVVDPLWRQGAGDCEFPINGPTGFSSDALIAEIGEARSLVLHYVGYAFHRKGIPFWLVKALKRATAQGAQLVTVFHEIWSSGPPWRSVFYLSPLQKWLVAEILKLSRHAFSSTRWAVAELSKLKPGAVTLLPIPSSLCPDGSPPRRSRTAAPWRPIFFGQAWTRLPAVRRHQSLIQTLREKNLLDAALVLGKGASADSPSPDIVELRRFLPDEQIRILGERTHAGAADCFQDADFCLTQHPVRDACKSSAVMSAIACGCPVVFPESNEAFPLALDQHFLSCDGSASGIQRFCESIQAGRLPAIAARASEWYRANADWSIVAGKIAGQLSISPASKCACAS